MSEVAAQVRALVDGLTDGEAHALLDELRTPTIRAKWAAEHRTRLMAMLETPATKDLAERMWRAEWWTDDRMQSVLLKQLLILPSGADPRATPRISLQITTDAANTPNAMRFLGLIRDYDVYDLIAFARLDVVDPATVAWRDITRTHSGIITVGSTLAGVIAKQAHTD